jgi:ferric-dicitrate binding protein FerR (iron transport regulator)
MRNVNIEQLIQKSLTESLHSDEEQILSEWRAISGQNEAEYQALHDAWRASDQYKIPNWNVEQALEKFEKRVPLKKAKVTASPKVMKFPSWRRIAVAASFLLIVSAASYIFYEKFRDGSVNIAFAETDHQVISLADGSEVHLKKGATLSYPPAFNHHFRYVKLTGEAFFQIEKNDKKPFVVETDRSKVTVLGTAFVLDASNENSKVTDLYVTEGKVRFQSRLNDEVVLEVAAGKQASLNGKALIPLKETTFNDIAWHTKTLVFKNVQMDRVAKDISAFYGIEINLDRSDVAHCPITAPLPFQNAPLEDVLEILETLLSVQVELTGPNQYALIGGKCK